MKQTITRLLTMSIGLSMLIALIACTQDNSALQPAARSTNTPGPVVADDRATTAMDTDGAIVTPEPFEPRTSTTFITDITGDRVIEEAQSTLVRMEHGVYMTFETSELEPGAAYTIWWLFFNRPENCSDRACGLDDIALLDENGERLLDESGAPLPNTRQREAVQFSLLRATGSIVDEDGTAEFRAHIPLNDTLEAVVGPGLLDPLIAEIHLVARTHGPAIPRQIHEQLNTAWGGCPEGWPKEPCGDTQFAIHHSPTH